MLSNATTARTGTAAKPEENVPNPLSISRKPVDGPPIPFPRYLQAKIVKWHEAHGEKRCKRSPIPTSDVRCLGEPKVFDRNGEELHFC
ncbi:uncharacterized protein BP01DRAFT_198313 [Aspergillus saccharolyticus JOP 1030-1]|uniref:Uncharacterized protein n=1 Tax=Aspergillus saccharolyticus JOP 1030-1 TaxID=1450539 RepID=A0A319AMM9_9EURO|nr:hypothetical protein BP01DRAFT_198313 [Aspergillus saccharolyticus JOP 1030-1]PYH47812.1 hypothetical protein BP01DRAFT_198313 [Aspergillus saccharolyticus JOP 1030-1]